MLNAFDALYIWTAVRAQAVRDNVKEFLSEQDGVSNVVATIVVLLITVLLIAAFWTQLKGWVSGIMQTIFGTTFDDSGL